jgi:hypothetical protein
LHLSLRATDQDERIERTTCAPARRSDRGGAEKGQKGAYAFQYTKANAGKELLRGRQTYLVELLLRAEAKLGALRLGAL